MIPSGSRVWTRSLEPFSLRHSQHGVFTSFCFEYRVCLPPSGLPCVRALVDFYDGKTNHICNSLSAKVWWSGLYDSEDSGGRRWWSFLKLPKMITWTPGSIFALALDLAIAPWKMWSLEPWLLWCDVFAPSKKSWWLNGTGRNEKNTMVGWCRAVAAWLTTPRDAPEVGVGERKKDFPGMDGEP